MAALKLQAVTFDCAGTLVDVRWTLDGFARDCMEELGVELPPEAYAGLLQLYAASAPAYHAVNERGDAGEGEQFWRDLTGRWFNEFGVDEALIAPSRQVAAYRMADPGAGYFRLYPDVLGCLDALGRMGLRVAIVSNWDYTLHPILKFLGIESRFEVVLASLEEGCEKPDPRLFETCLERMSVAAGRAVHVGDDLTDDVGGAVDAGMIPVLLRRPAAKRASEEEFAYAPRAYVLYDGTARFPRGGKAAVIASLAELPEVLRSIG